MMATDREIQDAVGVIQRDYYEDVNSWADEFIERIKAGEFDDRDDFLDIATQEIDGARRVIITWQARLGLLVSDNDDAALEAGVIKLSDYDDIPWSVLMFAAFEADIYEAMGRKGIDVNDYEIFEDEDDE